MKQKLILFIFVLTISYPILAQAVYVTPSGKKYHKGSCRMVENVSTSLGISDAINKGYMPCKICNPPTPPNHLSSGYNTPRGTKPATVRCKGITKQGTKCKHMTSMGNGFCFQHNPDK